MFYFRDIKIGNRTLRYNVTSGKVVKVTHHPVAKETTVSKEQFKKAGWSRKES